MGMHPLSPNKQEISISLTKNVSVSAAEIGTEAPQNCRACMSHTGLKQVKDWKYVCVANQKGKLSWPHWYYFEFVFLPKQNSLITISFVWISVVIMLYKQTITAAAA